MYFSYNGVTIMQLIKIAETLVTQYEAYAPVEIPRKA